MMFFEFYQYNPDGFLDYDEVKGISHYVIVEAPDAKAANRRAAYLGLDVYRGERWYPAFDTDGTVLPECAGRLVAPYCDFPWNAKHLRKCIAGAEGYIHYLSGDRRPFWFADVPKEHAA